MDPAILVVDDNDDSRFALTSRLRVSGYTNIRTVDDGRAALAALRRETIHLVLLDMLIPRLDGYGVLSEMKSDPALRDIAAIVVSAVNDVDSVARCIKLGAVDYLTKPFNPVLLKARIDSCLERVRYLSRRSESLEARLVGPSAAMSALRRDILHLAGMDVPVLIYGETGAGKEVVARCLHDFSRRNKKPYVAVNCAAIPDAIFESEFFGHEPGAFTGASSRRIGRFEYASGGSLLLDEIETMPMGLQAKLLRVLQDQTLERVGSNKPISVDVRILAAAKVDLHAASYAGRFRQDLYFRLNVAELHIPPLRARPEDIPVLFQQFVKEATNRHGHILMVPSQDFMAELANRPWPGNVRELRTAAERFVIGVNSPAETPPDVKPADAASLADQVAEFEKRVIKQSLRHCQGDIARAAMMLDLPRRTLYHKMHRYMIARDPFAKDTPAMQED
jgi:two-component system, NtrC family, C4-dicarboxylate transport response regulator DctD